VPLLTLAPLVQALLEDGGTLFVEDGPTRKDILAGLRGLLDLEPVQVVSVADLADGPLSGVEARFLDGCLLGDRDACDRLRRLLCRQLHGIIGPGRLDGDDVRDLEQDLWVTLLRDLPAPREPAALRGWVRSVVKNRWRLWGAQRGRCRTRERPLLESADPSRAPPQELEVARRQIRGELDRALDRLPEREHEVVRAHFLRGLSYEELGRQLGMPVGSVGPTIHRALTRLARRPVLRELYELDLALT
jgi:RNA polymerase sigma factor (sigma-70 family)